MLHILPSSPDAADLPPPSAMLPYTQHPYMSPRCDKTHDPNPNPNSLNTYWPYFPTLISTLAVIRWQVVKQVGLGSEADTYRTCRYIMNAAGSYKRINSVCDSHRRQSPEGIEVQ